MNRLSTTPSGEFPLWFVAHDWYRLPDGTYVRAQPRSSEESTWTLVADAPVERIYCVEPTGSVYIWLARRRGSSAKSRRIPAPFAAADIQSFPYA